MSFVKTLALLGAGFAAAKGFDRYRTMGGMDGVKDAMKGNPALAPMAEAIDKMTGGQGKPADVSAGMAAMLGAMGTAAAAGMSNLGAMVDKMTGTNAATATMEANAKIMIRAMIMGAKADGVITAAERAEIEAHLDELTPDERAFVAAEMDAPVDPIGFARDVAEGARGQTYAAAAAMARSDTPQEQQFLAALGGALGLDRTARAAVHAQLGLAPPTV
ncbi:MAG: DUF533 domain-containing protein [Gemmobacter sp.]